ncbi:protein-export membrane protein SecF [Candidatus Roizmanbacteria bacterium RIFCSPHIGHO2_02_FULL_37_15]|uniref:Protein-export membrane protein SecF n=1 Tax=Candidatus Roizmanbacteria bacterium RIFCSPLOWO2_01_FULL_37_16 TaxID=1802058 RepID=A0A1F7IPS7_9BACT|nr:MAG: protein-export membrane protein SecF [Candidatus Roizmanbacteria bacterium RIFCSPHIGHO2_01_FULL_37_16b]OGK21486.1 MAG: protein-export membrane protein SecF [Candidatus Roizmanbacteria bacterium RIFCSPHIGHO2_02_FULL_37_15]OGK34126.1 MAG: protein-export membrane protein SecF [Candidatus Roizmanbacteria bacterium RIFCSPHIGHO2_12_FULL_36_11]OGK45356.1 MAG: protein-export membrane protein SecF [Candidatus Roizmanbacteria bacterium RIFCSPLOWO2_01_FULL_37_16]OGK57657.1 MAG: protein-export memb
MVNFLKYRWLYFFISSAIIVIGLFSIVRWGFRYSIDFIGGTNLEYQTKKSVEIEKVKEAFTKNKVEILNIIKKETVITIRTKPIDEKKEFTVRKDIESSSGSNITMLRFETVGPVIGKETIRKTVIASLFAILGILIYMSLAFKSFYFAVSAIIALIHDFLVVVGTYSLMSHFLGAEVDLLFVTALLTTMSFSVHDTIVIFDKIREYGKTTDKIDMEYYANRALSETLVRSLNNSMTIIFMLLALILLGGSTIKFFTIALLVGTLTGTYSSPFVATPILVWLEKRRK